MTTRPERYLISVAAQRLGMHPQTLRKYERLGLVRPQRTAGSLRVYSTREIDRLRLIKSLVDESGVNLAGVRRLLRIVEVVERMRPLVAGRPPAATHRTGERERRLIEEVDELFRILGLDTREP